MMDKVYCPWCGREMQLEESLPFSGVFAYVCECGAVSPNENGAEEALKAALKRPLQRPLTLEEAHQQFAVWIEGQIDTFPALLNGYQPEDGVYSAFVRQHGDCFVGKNSLYGNKWRCWIMKPTDEEREAAKWEEANYRSNCGAKMD